MTLAVLVLPANRMIASRPGPGDRWSARRWPSKGASSHPSGSGKESIRSTLSWMSCLNLVIQSLSSTEMYPSWTSRLLSTCQISTPAGEISTIELLKVVRCQCQIGRSAYGEGTIQSDCHTFQKLLDQPRLKLEVLGQFRDAPPVRDLSQDLREREASPLEHGDAPTFPRVHFGAIPQHRDRISRPLREPFLVARRGRTPSLMADGTGDGQAPTLGRYCLMARSFSSVRVAATRSTTDRSMGSSSRDRVGRAPVEVGDLQ